MPPVEEKKERKKERTRIKTGLLASHEEDLLPRHLPMVPVRGVGGLDRGKRDVGEVVRRLQPERGVAPEAGGLEDVAWLVELGGLNLAVTTIDGALLQQARGQEEGGWAGGGGS